MKWRIWLILSLAGLVACGGGSSGDDDGALDQEGDNGVLDDGHDNGAPDEGDDTESPSEEDDDGSSNEEDDDGSSNEEDDGGAPDQSDDNGAPDEDDENGAPDEDETSGTEVGEFTALAAQLDETEVGDSGEARINNINAVRLAIGESGDVIFVSSLRERHSYDTLSGSSTRFIIPAGGDEPIPYLSPFLQLPDYPGATVSGEPTRHGPAPDGSVVMWFTLEDGETETHVAYHYHDGNYDLLFTGDDIPGLPGYTLSHSNQEVPRENRDSFVVNRHGDMAARLSLQDDEGQYTYAWLRGSVDEGFEPVMEWGDGTGESYLFADESLTLPFTFYWPFLGDGHYMPIINNEGRILFFAKSKTSRDAHPEDEFGSLRAIWQVDPEDEAPTYTVRTREDFIDQSTGETTELEDIHPAGHGYSLNDHGEIALRNEWWEDEAFTGRSELWLKNDQGLSSIARENKPAPNLGEVGITSGALFDDVGIGALTNNGTIFFSAVVEGKGGLWVSDGDTTTPVIMDTMDAPDMDGFVFKAIGQGNTRDFPPLVNNQDQAVFWAEIEHTGTGDTADSLWSYNGCGGVSLLAAEDQELTVSGVPELVDWQDGEAVWEAGDAATRDIQRLRSPDFDHVSRGFGPNTGLPLALNDAGDFVFVVSLAGSMTFGDIEEGNTGTIHRQSALVRTRLPECDVET